MCFFRTKDRTEKPIQKLESAFKIAIYCVFQQPKILNHLIFSNFCVMKTFSFFLTKKLLGIKNSKKIETLFYISSSKVSQISNFILVFLNGLPFERYIKKIFFFKDFAYKQGAYK